jgi:hypothetical protein
MGDQEMSEPHDGNGDGTSTSKRDPKVIAVFSDGTGNSAAKVLKTNVWRLYQALDANEPQPRSEGGRRAAAGRLLR